MIGVLSVVFSAGMTQAGKLPRLKVSDNRRFLVHEDGTPFFWLGDTAWTLFHRLTREEVDQYLADRAKKSFTLVQAGLMSAGRLEELPANVYGDRPLADEDPARPNEAFFEHVDHVIDRAESHGLYVGLLPTWGHCFVQGNFDAPRLFDADTAFAYGQSLGDRYKDRTHIIWILGGDTVPTEEDEQIYRAMARGIAVGVNGGEDYDNVLMTFHPRGGGHSSSEWFHEDEWLDFNMMHTGPRRGFRNYETIVRDCGKRPVKPAMDGEPGYENATKERLSAADVRSYAYWAVFAGGHGHTYGALEVWQMYKPEFEPLDGAERYWHEAIDYPGASDMQHLRNLLESRPFLIRIPDHSLIVSGQGATVEDHVQATRGSDGSYALVYIASGEPVTVAMDKISGQTAAAHWYDPREGTAKSMGQFPTTGMRKFIPPSSGPGNDWVLVLDDAAKSFPPPGATASD